MILARLAEYEPESNNGNRPTESLRSLFLPWIRFSDTPDRHRLETLEALTSRYPQAGWNLLVRIHPSNHDWTGGHPLPRWRPWGQDVASSLTHQEYWKYVGAIGKCLLVGVKDDAQRWTIMVGIVSSLSSETRAQTLASLLEQTEVLRQQNAALGLWGKIRLELNRHRSFPDAEWAMAPEEVALLADTYARLTPSDVVAAHAWLFDNRIRLPNPLPALSNSLGRPR